MTKPINLFVSFSGEDQRDVRKLFASLQLQGLDVWDYSREGEELPLGQPLDRGLMRRIDNSDYFIAVVSANSMNEQTGHNPQLEVQYALERGFRKQGLLLPVLLLNNRPREWSGAYRQLEDLMRAEVDPGSYDSIEEGVRRVCGCLSVNYVPPLLKDERIFFTRRFMEETQEASAIPLSNARFFELMRVMNQCASKVLDKDWAGAIKRLEKVIDDDEKRPEERFYYPQIIKGVCELQLGEYAKAETTFLTAKNHPRRDESAFAGLGHTYYLQQRYPQALAAFEQALALNPADKDIEFNILGAHLETGEQLDDDAILRHFDTLELLPEDRFKVNKIKGIFFYKKGKYNAAAAVFNAMRIEEMDDACADYYSSALENLGRKGEALAVLRAVAYRLENTNLYHLLARAYLRMGRRKESLQVYEEKLCQPTHRTRRFLIDYARLLQVSGSNADEKRVRELCDTVLTLDCFPNAKMQFEDFFYMGFAHYLLGRQEAARSYFEQSSGFSDKFYDDPSYQLGPRRFRNSSGGM